MLLIIWEEKESFQLLSDIEGQMVGGTTHILDTVSSPDDDLREDLIAILLDVLAAPSVQFPDNGSVWSEERLRRVDCSPWHAWHQPHCWGVGPQSSLQLLGCSQNGNYRTQVKSLTCNVSLQSVSLPDKSHVWMLYMRAL